MRPSPAHADGAAAKTPGQESTCRRRCREDVETGDDAEMEADDAVMPGCRKTPLRQRPEEPRRAGESVHQSDVRACAHVRAHAISIGSATALIRLEELVQFLSNLFNRERDRRGARGIPSCHCVAVDVVVPAMVVQRRCSRWPRRTGAGDGASRRYRAQSRSARVAVLVGWRRPVILVPRAAGPHLSI
jgi:hypothetical protein